MDNQQERFEKRMIWLTAIIEGEGWVSLIKRLTQQKNGKKTVCYTPIIGAVNSDKAIICEIKSLFELLGLKYRFQERTSSIGSDGVYRKTRWELSIMSSKSIKILAEKILPYMIGEKKNRVHKLLEFFSIRESKGTKGPKSKYGNEEESIYQELYSYKGKSRSKILNDFMPCSLELQG